MPNPQEMQLIRICSKPETLKRGKELLRLAILKTRPGSGYDLAMGASGLPPICAYIASQELNNGDITEKIAQSASCLNDKVFARTLNLVRKAITDNSGPNIQVAMTYVSLVRSYTIGMVARVVGWMEDTEKTVIQQGVLLPTYDVNSPLVKCAIFFWVAQVCKIPQVKKAYLLEDYKLPKQIFDSLLKLLSQSCAPVAKVIAAEVAVLKKALRDKMFPPTPTPTASTSKSPSTPASVSASTFTFISAPAPAPTPSTSQMQDPVTSSTSVLAEPSSSGAALAQKRTANFDKSSANESTGAPETPTKRRKLYVSGTRKTVKLPANKTQDISAFEAAISGRASPDKGASVSTAETTIPTTPSQPGPSITPLRRTPRFTRQEPVEIPRLPEVDMDVDLILQTNRSSSPPPPPPRRFRPIFLDRQQWSLRDPRIEREWPAMQEHARRMTDLYGHPFAAHVPDVEMQSV